MALDSIIRNAIAIADQQTRGTQVLLWHWSALEKNEFGKVTYDVPFDRRGIVQQESRLFTSNDGTQRGSETKVTLIGPVVVTDDDAFAVADTSVALPSAPTAPENTMGQILEVKGLLDPTTGKPYMVEIWFGKATGQ